MEGREYVARVRSATDFAHRCIDVGQPRQAGTALQGAHIRMLAYVDERLTPHNIINAQRMARLILPVYDRLEELAGEPHPEDPR